VRPRLQNLGMDRPFIVALAGAVELLAVEGEQHEILLVEHLAERDAMPLQPEAAALRIAHRDMAEDAVAMAVQLEDPARLGEELELGGERRIGRLDIRQGLRRGGHQGSSPTLFQSRQSLWTGRRRGQWRE